MSPRGIYARTDTHLAAMSAARKGRPLPLEQRLAMSDSHKGRALTPEHRAAISAGCVQHGHNRTRTAKPSTTYRSWQNMISRCEKPKNISYPRYGGRGIVVYGPWKAFASFLSDMGERPAGKTLDRIDNAGPYAPWNCKWSTLKEQARNRRSRLLINGGGTES